MTPRSRTGVAGSRGAPVRSGDDGISVVAAAWGVCSLMRTTVGRATGRSTGAAALPGTRREPVVPGRVTCHTAAVKNFLIKVVINGIALWVAALVVDGVNLAEGEATWGKKLLTIVLVALLFGLVNAVIKPIVKLFSLPFIIVTLGLFTFVVNAFMLQITEWISKPLGLSFSIDDFFWDAVFAAVVITLVSWALSVVLPDDDD